MPLQHPGARTAACAAEQFLGAFFVQALVCAQAASTSTIQARFGRGPFAPCSCPSLACPSAAARSACSSAVARSDDADIPGAFLKLWRWRHCLIVSRVAAPAGLGGPQRARVDRHGTDARLGPCRRRESSHESERMCNGLGSPARPSARASAGPRAPRSELCVRAARNCVLL